MIGLSSDKARERLFAEMEGSGDGLGIWLKRDTLAITGMSIGERGKEGKGVQFVISVPPTAWKRRT